MLPATTSTEIDALQECNVISDDEIDVVLLPPENVNGNTDNECGNDSWIGKRRFWYYWDKHFMQSDQNKKKKY